MARGKGNSYYGGRTGAGPLGAPPAITVTERLAIFWSHKTDSFLLVIDFLHLYFVNFFSMNATYCVKVNFVNTKILDDYTAFKYFFTKSPVHLG